MKNVSRGTPRQPDWYGHRYGSGNPAPSRPARNFMVQLETAGRWHERELAMLRAAGLTVIEHSSLDATVLL